MTPCPTSRSITAFTGRLCDLQNGFRYSTPRTQEVVDVMFSNIKRAFFQPANSEHITLIHFHLYDPIMVNKKKTQDVQLFTEVVEMVQTLDGTRRNAYDPDEIEEEQREREKRNAINKQFERFCKAVRRRVQRGVLALRVQPRYERFTKGAGGPTRTGHLLPRFRRRCRLGLGRQKQAEVSSRALRAINAPTKSPA